MLVTRAGIYKMLVRIAKGEDTGHTSSPPICLHDLTHIALWSSGADSEFLDWKGGL